MPKQLKEVTGVFRTEIFREDDFMIGAMEVVNGDASSSAGGNSNGSGNGKPPAKRTRPRLSDNLDRMMGRIENRYANQLKFKGSIPEDEISFGLEYRFYGHTEHSTRYGDTFVVKTFVRSQPHGREGIVRYLQEAPHVGQATATALWNKFGSDSVRILRESPDVAAAAIGNRFNLEKATEAASKLAEMAAMEDCTIELIDLLGGRGFPRNVGKAAVKVWGNRAAEIIRRNPYVLMAFRGCGFLRTDAMYLDLGLPPAKLKRQSLSAWHTIASDTSGHTWHPIDEAVKGIKSKVAGANLDPIKAVKLAKRANMIALRRHPENKVWIAEGPKARAEAYVAKKIAESEQETAAWADLMESEAFAVLSDHQRGHLFDAFDAGRSIMSLGGPPGTGKTWSAAAVINAVGREHGWGSIAVAAPTGKAAVRLTEAMQGYGLQLQATTIHRLLEVESSPEMGGGWTFRHNEYDPLEYKFLVVDESSMVDTNLMASLLAARAKGTHILFVGDINQLSPVGHGAPLRDFIRAGMPTGILTEIQRNAGTIVHACHAIKDGKQFPVNHQDFAPNAGPPRNLALVGASNGKQAVEKIVELIKKIKAGGAADPVWETQVVVAVNKKSPLSRKLLNKRLQDELNPHGRGHKNSPFRAGDKVIQLRNGFLPAAANNDPKADSDGKLFIANGEMGKVVDVHEKLTFVEFPSPKRLVKIPRGVVNDKSEGGKNGDGSGNDEKTDTGCDLDLAYAISVHKSQGSEFPVVIVALDEYPGAKMVCSREWLYTAISRAKKACFLVGKLSTAMGMIRREALNKRKTFLAELIESEREGLKDRAMDGAAGRLGAAAPVDTGMDVDTEGEGEKLAVGVEPLGTATAPAVG